MIDKQKPTITACIITNDDERVIKTVDSIKNVVNEIILCHTVPAVKLKDKFKDISILKETYFEWNNSYSDARNACIKQATKDYILIIDSDEIIKDKSIDINTNIDYYFLKVYNYGSHYYSVRMFKNNLGFYYKNIIHENLEHCFKNRKSGRSTLEIYSADISMEELYKKLESNKKYLLRDKDSPMRNAHLCHHCLLDDELDDCIKYGEAALNQSDLNSDRKAIVCNVLYECYKRRGSLNLAKNFLWKSLEFVPKQLQARSILVKEWLDENNIKRKSEILEQLKYMKNIIEMGISELSGDSYYSLDYINDRINAVKQWH